MAVAERLTNNQTRILKALKRKPRTTRETAEFLKGKHPYVSYAATHSSLRRLEDRQLVRRTMRHVSNRTPDVIAWELTDKARDLL